MQPQQHPAPTPHDPYDFIMNPTTAQKPPTKFGIPSGGSKTKRILVIIGGLFVVIVIGLVLATVLTAGDKSQSDQLISLAQEQAEIIRIADLARAKGALHTTNAAVLAANTSLSLTSSQKQLLALVKKGKKPSEKDLALKTNSQTDRALVAASQSNTYDEVFVSIIDKELQDYQSHLQQMLTSSKTTAEKQTLQTAYNGASVLLGKED